jgi:uncharacterized protein involved in outer membrane biogenesis
MRLRTVVIGVVVVFVALIATGVAILMSIDFNQYKGQVADAVKAATGRELTIGGNFKLGLSLTPSVSVDEVSFANVSGGSRANMLTLKHLAVQMELLPLLSRQIKVDSLVLDGADILLETDAKGQGNWVFGTPAAAGTAGSTASAPAAAGGARPLPQVSTVQIRDSIVTYHDGVTGASHSFKVDKLDATTGNGKINIVLAAVLGGTPLNVTGNVGAPELLSGSVPYPLDLTVASGNTTASIKGEVAQITKMQGINLQVAAKGNSLADLDGLAGAKLPPLGPYSFGGVVNDMAGGYKVTAMQLTMGGSSLTGDVGVAFGGKRPKFAANLAATKIDLKDFGVKPAPAGAGSGGSSGGSSDGRVFPADPLPFAGLTAADADLNLAAQQMIKAPVTMENVKLVLSLANGKLQVKPFSAGLAGGTLNVTLSVDGARSPAPVAVDVAANQVEAGSLMQVLAGSSVLSGGRVNMKLGVAGAGNSVRAIMAGLNGKLDATMGPGNINNAFAKLMLADLFKLLSFGSGGDSSNLKCVAVRYDINHGLADTRQLAVETSGATIIGKGTINLATEGLDLHLVPYATSANLTALAIPMQVGGTMAHPNVVPDAAALATGTLKTVLTAPTSVLGTVGSIAGIGGGQSQGSTESAGAGCGASASSAAAPSQQKQGGSAPAQPSSGGLLPDIGGAAKGATDTLKSLLP